MAGFVIVSGRDLVTWLLAHVEGLSSRREAKTYAAGLLRTGYIRHTVNKSTFSEKCYYGFGDAINGRPLFCFFFFKNIIFINFIVCLAS